MFALRDLDLNLPVVSYSLSKIIGNASRCARARSSIRLHSFLMFISKDTQKRDKLVEILQIFVPMYQNLH